VKPNIRIAPGQPTAVDIHVIHLPRGVKTPLSRPSNHITAWKAQLEGGASAVLDWRWPRPPSTILRQSCLVFRPEWVAAVYAGYTPARGTLSHVEYTINAALRRLGYAQYE